MKILLAVDGSECTTRAVAWLVTQRSLLEGSEVLVLHVQPALPPRVGSFVGRQTVVEYHAEEAAKVLAPVEASLRGHEIAFRTSWVVGHPAQEIVRASTEEGAQLIVMGTHGHGLLGRALLGSVTQGVLAHAQVPVLLVK